MKFFTILSAVLFCLLSPSPGRSQNTGRIECARNDGYVYLYSSVITLDVRATLQCAEIVQILGRDGTYFSVRDVKGDTGFVPMASIVVLKDQPGTGLPTTGAASPRVSASTTTMDRGNLPLLHQQVLRSSCWLMTPRFE